jgi:hypothetical protein
MRVILVPMTGDDRIVSAGIGAEVDDQHPTWS